MSNYVRDAMLNVKITLSITLLGSKGYIKVCLLAEGSLQEQAHNYLAVDLKHTLEAGGHYSPVLR